MAIRYWKRMRDEGAKHASDAPNGANPWVEPDPLPTIDLDALASRAAEPDPAERAAAYNDWADRLRAKRVNAQRTIAAQQSTDAGLATEDRPTYWTTDAVFAESRRVDERVTERPNPWRVQELLDVLDLREGANLDDVSRAYKQLAKQHHPDRFVEADEDTRRFHQERMACINQAYRTLRQLELA
jgi:DnaJ-domain-containing protein 1